MAGLAFRAYGDKVWGYGGSHLRGGFRLTGSYHLQLVQRAPEGLSEPTAAVRCSQGATLRTGVGARHLVELCMIGFSFNL